ncbi:uncharacterized protein LOC144375475 [Ictidomys tridecemlineatus]
MFPWKRGRYRLLSSEGGIRGFPSSFLHAPGNRDALGTLRGERRDVPRTNLAMAPGPARHWPSVPAARELGCQLSIQEFRSEEGDAPPARCACVPCARAARLIREEPRWPAPPDPCRKRGADSHACLL